MKLRPQRMQYAAWGAREYLTALRWMMSGQVAAGPEPEALRRDVEAIYGCHALPVNAGRTALRLALRAFAMRRPGRRRVLLPGYLCPSVVSTVRELGLEPHPVEVGVDLNLDPNRLVAALNESVLAVVAVHMYGCPARIVEIERLCREAGVFLVDDAAQVVGVSVAGRMLGGFGDAGLLSFAQSKTIVTGVRGSGGILLVNNPDFEAELVELHSELNPPDGRVGAFAIFLIEYIHEHQLGRGSIYMSKLLERMGKPSRPVDVYQLALIGNMEAGIARAQLAKLQRILAAKIRVAALYSHALAALPEVHFPQYALGQYVTRVLIKIDGPAKAIEVRRRLGNSGVATRMPYPAWATPVVAPFASSLSSTLLELPSGAEMSDRCVQAACKALETAISESADYTKRLVCE